MSDPQRSFTVVTGGSNGIGFELARQFLANGFDVLIAAQDEAHLNDAKGQLSSGGGAVTCWAGLCCTGQQTVAVRRSRLTATGGERTLDARGQASGSAL